MVMNPRRSKMFPEYVKCRHCVMDLTLLFFSIFVSFTCASIVRLVLGQIVKGGKLHVYARNKTVFENGPFVTYMYYTSLKWLEQMMKLLIPNISPG
jgi:hypothetical protein